MDLNKIGKFISINRKKQNLTQELLAKKLGVTNKTVSRWENGNYMPDISLLIPLSEILNITVNELLIGDFISIKNETLENNLKTVVKLSNTKIKKSKRFSYILVTTILLILVSGFFIYDYTFYKPAPFIEGDVSKWELFGSDIDYEMGLTEYGYPVFKNPEAALRQAKNDYAGGIKLIEKEFGLLFLSKYTYEKYKTYGWQVSIGDESLKQEARMLSSFLDIYENSYK